MRFDPRLRHTKIVATIGPASASEDVLTDLIEAGVNVIRINSSHGTAETRGRWIELVKRVRERLQMPVAILVDLQGPRIRVGSLDAPIDLVEGQEVVFAPEEDVVSETIPTTYDRLADDVEIGKKVLLDDGLLEVEVVGVDGRRVRGIVRSGGTLKSQKGMNLPGVHVSAPAATDKDLDDIDLAARHGADIIGLSFVRRAADVRALRKRVPDSVRLLCKIEKDTALTDLTNIIEAADALMVARGDLGVELPFEEVPLAQKQVIRSANRAGIPVVTATQMLESMIASPRPTRAEASDVANAVLDGTDAVMLSAETAIGANPVAAVEAMARIIEAIERSSATDHFQRRRRSDRSFAGDEPTVADAIAQATSVAADMLDAALIICFTSSGFTARQIAATRPTVPIVGLTPEPTTYQQLSLSWGVLPVLATRAPTYDQMLEIAREHLLSEELVHKGDRVVVTAGVPFDLPGTTNLLKVEVV